MSAVDGQVQAEKDVQRIARALDEEVRRWGPRYGTVVRNLLHRDVIRVGRRPQVGAAPMRGQTTIDEVME